MRLVPLTLTVMLTLTGCAVAAGSPPPAASTTSTVTTSSSTPASTTTTVPPAIPVLTPAPVVDPGVVADSVANAFWSTDARVDTTPTDAAARAAGWLTPKFAALTMTPLPAGADWLEMVAHRAFMTVVVTSGDGVVPNLPADTPAKATRVRILTLTPTGSDGWAGPVQYIVATFTLICSDGGAWLVDSITEDVPLGGAPAASGVLDAG